MSIEDDPDMKTKILDNEMLGLHNITLDDEVYDGMNEEMNGHVTP